MPEGIKYEKIANEFWEMQRIEAQAEKVIRRYLKNLYSFQVAKRSSPGWGKSSAMS